MPTQVLSGGVYVITQGATVGVGVLAVNDSLVQNLSAQPWALRVSPEILSLTSVRGQPVLVRGVDPRVFLAMDRGTWASGGQGSGSWAVAGSGLAARLGLDVGTVLTLTGSIAPRIALVPVTGIFRTATPSNDELLVSFPVARFFTSRPADAYYSVRVETSNASALRTFLRQYGSAFQLTAPSSTPISPSARLANLYLLYGTAGLPVNFLAEGLSEATNAIQVAALGLAVLVVLLLAFGIHAVQARVFADHRPQVGVLRALGASRGWVLRRSALEALPLAALASVTGLAFGFLLSTELWSASGLLVLGHTIHTSFDPVVFGILACLLLVISIVSQLLLPRTALRDRPGESIRETTVAAPPVSLEVVLRE